MNRPRDRTMECDGDPMNTEDDSGILLFTQDGHSLTRCNELIGLWKKQRLTEEQTRELNEGLGNGLCLSRDVMKGGVVMKTCEVCGVTNDKVCGKSGKFGMDLCVAHTSQMRRYGKIIKANITLNNTITINNGYAEVLCKLGSFIVDIEDIGKIKEYTWHIDYTRGDPRPVSSVSGKTVYAHKIIMNSDELIVCINKNTLDCRKENLLQGTRSNAHSNSKKYLNNSSGYTGVGWKKRINKWVAYIKVSGKYIHLGSFSNINDAIAARKAAEAKYFRDFAYDASRDVTLTKEATNETKA